MIKTYQDPAAGDIVVGSPGIVCVKSQNVGLGDKQVPQLKVYHWLYYMKYWFYPHDIPMNIPYSITMFN